RNAPPVQYCALAGVGVVILPEAGFFETRLSVEAAGYMVGLADFEEYGATIFRAYVFEELG
ncbi:MAG: hypothetical protein WCA99_08540, partial [Candidatus Sulfotelmatobacter sp.]